MPGETIDQRRVILRPVILGNQHVLVAAIPAPGPVLVRPHQAEREIHAGIGEHRLDRLLQQPAPVEPVEIMHEAAQPGPARQLHLAPQCRGAVQRVMPEVARHPRLVLPLEARHRPPGRSPFGKPLAPPGIVLIDGMELRQIERQHLRPPDRPGRQGLHLLEIRPRPCVAPHRVEHPGLARRRHRMDPQQPADAAEMQQRVFRQIAVQVAPDVIARVEPGRRVAPLAKPPVQEMLERIHARRRDVGIGLQIECRIEFRQRTRLAAPPPVEEVPQQCLAGLRRVAGAIPGEVEMRRRRPALRLAAADVVQQRILAGHPDIGVLPQVPLGGEIRIRQPALARAMIQIMRDGIDARGIVIRAAIPLAVHQAARLQVEHIPLVSGDDDNRLAFRLRPRQQNRLVVHAKPPSSCARRSPSRSRRDITLRHNR